jgi:hypothetical protein
LKPFLDGTLTAGFSIQKKDVLILIKSLALQSYLDSIKRDTAHRAYMNHFAQDYDYLLEDSEKWDTE